MSFRSFWRRILSNSRTTRHGLRTLLQVESFEDRLTPSITVTVQPHSQAVAVGANFTLTSMATPITNTTIQWQESTDLGKVWSNFSSATPESSVSSATPDTFEFTAPATVGQEEFRAVFRNGTAAALSNTAVITFDVPPTVTVNPVSQTIAAGKTVTFTAADTATPAGRVQWQVSTNGTTWSNLTGFTTTTLSFVAHATQNGKEYRAVFSNALGSVDTTAATLTVNSIPVITVQPKSQSVVINKPFTLSVTAVGAPTTYSYQWYISTNGGTSFTPVSEATSATEQFTAPAQTSSLRYYVKVTNSNGTTNSQQAVISVDGPPVITVQPRNLTVAARAVATFTAAAFAIPAASVHWQVSTNGGASWAAMGAMADSTTLSFPARLADSGFLFRAVFTNSYGSTTSSAVRLTVT